MQLEKISCKKQKENKRKKKKKHTFTQAERKVQYEENIITII